MKNKQPKPWHTNNHARSCDHCKHSEPHWCNLLQRTMKNMDVKSCGEWTQRKEKPIRNKASLDILDGWLESFFAIESAYELLRQAFSATPESKVANAMYSVYSKYTDLVAEKIGDEDGWLEWFLWDNNAGRKGLMANKPGKRMRRIKSLKDLKWILS